MKAEGDARPRQARRGRHSRPGWRRARCAAPIPPGSAGSRRRGSNRPGCARWCRPGPTSPCRVLRPAAVPQYRNAPAGRGLELFCMIFSNAKRAAPGGSRRSHQAGAQGLGSILRSRAVADVSASPEQPNPLGGEPAPARPVPLRARLAPGPETGAAPACAEAGLDPRRASLVAIVQC